MSAVGPLGGEGRIESRAWIAWGLVAVAWVAMFGPSYWSAARGIWQTEEYGHGPVVLLVALWLFWRARDATASVDARASAGAGWLVFTLGLVCYVLGRAFSISSLEFLSQPLLVGGGLLLTAGPKALKACWFPLLFLCFAIPLPQTLVDAATGPLKQGISVIVVEVLHLLGYPVGRAGVVITVGQYQLLVADACSGLNSIVSLLALSALYVYVVQRRGALHLAVLTALILPIAVAANMVRVTLLVLITFHFGDAAGQGFLHGLAGVTVFLVALVLLVLLDHTLGALPFMRAFDAAKRSAV